MSPAPAARPRWRLAARAEPDGYTIAIGNAGTNAAAYTIYPMLPFKADAFAPIAVVAKTFGIVALRKDFPARTVQEFIAYAQTIPQLVEIVEFMYFPWERERAAVDAMSKHRSNSGALDSDVVACGRRHSPLHPFDGARKREQRTLAGFQEAAQEDHRAAGPHDFT
jgi:hypothetical protein